MITLGRVVGIPLRVDRGWFVVFVLVTSSLAFVGDGSTRASRGSVTGRPSRDER